MAGRVDQRTSILGAVGLAVTGTLPQLGAFVLEPDLDLTGGPVQLLGNLGTNFKRGKRVDRKGSAENGNFFTGSSLSLLVEVLDTLNSQIDFVSRRTTSRLSLDTSQSLGGLEGLLGKITLDGSSVAKGKKPFNSLKKLEVVVLVVVVKELVAHGVLEINNRHDVIVIMGKRERESKKNVVFGEGKGGVEREPISSSSGRTG